MDMYCGRKDNDPQRCPSLILGTCAFVNLHGERDVTGEITGLYLEMGRLFELSIWVRSDHLNT